MSEPAEKRKPREINATWQEPPDMEPVFSDHLHLQLAGDKYYMTFGRLELPWTDLEGSPTELEIKPAGTRFVVPIKAMRKIRDLLNRVVKDDPEEGE